MSESWAGSESSSGVDPDSCAGFDSVSKGTFELLGDICSSSDGASEDRVDSNEKSENSEERFEEALLEPRVCPGAMVILRIDSRESQEWNERCWPKE